MPDTLVAELIPESVAERYVEHVADKLNADRVRFLWNQQRYLLENIKLSDTKAGFVMTFAAALISAGSSPNGRISLNLSHAITTPRGVLGAAFAILGVAGLVASALYAAWSIRPRLRSNSQPSPVSWVNVAMYSSVEAFREVSRASTDASLADHLADQVFYMSCVGVAKYKLVARAITLAGIGGVCLTVSILLH